jgi:hypothetical protein
VNQQVIGPEGIERSEIELDSRRSFFTFRSSDVSSVLVGNNRPFFHRSTSEFHVEKIRPAVPVTRAMTYKIK